MAVLSEILRDDNLSPVCFFSVFYHNTTIIMTNSPFILTAKTFSGLEEVLANELTALGASDVIPGNRVVGFTGDMEMIVKANLWCRTALNILRQVSTFAFTDKDSFFSQMIDIPWSDYFDVDQTISVYGVAHRSELFKNTMFLGQLTKDAIADHFREKTGRRPDVDNRDAGIKINVYINNENCVVSLDSSGDPLFKRGYRREGGSAPLNEVLAAGLIIMSGWDRESTLLDPMCGSGTFSVEGAMMAANMAPGLLRKDFGFLRWRDAAPELLDNLRETARGMQVPVKPKIIASDINIKSLDEARQNIMEAGLMGSVKVQRNDFFTFHPPAGGGWLIMNPPYGHRIRQDDLPTFYKQIGDTLKQHYAGFHAGIISQQYNGLRHVGLKPRHRFPVFNGPLECRFVVYELFSGSHKEHVVATRPKRPRLT
jgi:putative N6-adenine-specific DNA methylase